MTTKYKPGRSIDGWELMELLGTGGNAEVWKAADPAGSSVALKILKSVRPGSEPYLRFRSEIEILQRVDERPGVLPALAFSLPEMPSKQSPAWLAMPVASTITQALGEDPGLETVIEAVAAIAHTLAEFSVEHIYHRDIKPDNLYRYEEQWAVGDFGLVDFPGKPELTEAGHKLGPLHFLAPEMLLDPAGAEGGPADVYGLTKTLWVLATGQRYPPPGEQRIDVPQLTLSAYVDHPKARFLDRLIENATKHNPDERPSMAEFAAELDAWLAEPSRPVSPSDFSDIAARVKALMEPGRREKEHRDLLGKEAWDAGECMKQFLEPMLGYLAKARMPGDTRGFAHDPHHLQNALYTPGRDIGDLVWTMRGWNRTGDRIGLPLWSGFSLRVFANGRLWLAVGHIVGTRGGEVVWSDERVVPIGSAQQELAMSALANGLISNLRPALERFEDLLAASVDKDSDDS